jgi:hypothetical protein
VRPAAALADQRGVTPDIRAVMRHDVGRITLRLPEHTAAPPPFTADLTGG